MVAGKLAFFPWLTVPKPVNLGGFRFQRVETQDPSSALGPEVSVVAGQIFSRYFDVYGHPIKACTVATRIRGKPHWDIPEARWSSLIHVSSILALSFLSEQRFLANDPRLNSSVFRPIFQGIVPDQTWINITAYGRGRSYWHGGISLKKMQSGIPVSAISVKCPDFPTAFAKALYRTRKDSPTLWNQIEQSLPFFLLGHSEDGLPDEHFVLLSAIAFERLLGPINTPAALDLAEKFTRIWCRHSGMLISDAKRTVPDPKWHADQQDWPIHKKWIKELYEARNLQAHGNPVRDLSSNWDSWMHLVISAFSYPLTIKLMMESEGYYTLSNKELGQCDAIDFLLDSDWNNGSRKGSEWPQILSMYEHRRDIRQALDRAIDQVRGVNI